MGLLISAHLASKALTVLFLVVINIYTVNKPWKIEIVSPSGTRVSMLIAHSRRTWVP